MAAAGRSGEEQRQLEAMEEIDEKRSGYGVPLKLKKD